MAEPLAQERGFDLDLKKLMTSEVNQEYFFSAHIAFWFQQAFVLEAMSLIFIAYKIVQVFRISRNINILLESLESASLMATTLFLFVNMIMIGMTIIAMNIWGSSIF